jgi:hypothetical protein
MVSMRLTSLTRATLVVALSFWVAAAACVIGCMQPVLAQNGLSVSRAKSLNRTQPDLMPDMACCNHEKSPSGPTSDKRPPHHAVSCCPLDARATPTQKLNPLTLGTAFNTVSSHEIHFALALFCDPLVFTHTFWYSGRDTLLKAHVLRI